MNRLKDKYKWIKRFLRNIRVYWPILCTDRWFDSAYLFALIAHKCRADAAMYRSPAAKAKDHNEVAQDLEMVADVCDRLKDPETAYWEPLLASHVAKWGEYAPGSFHREKVLNEEDHRLQVEDLKLMVSKHNDAVADDLRWLAQLFQRFQNWSD